MIKIYSPASIGNVGVGFDILGAALAPIDGSLLGDCVTIKSSKKFKLINKGNFSNQLPLNVNDNIVWKCWNYFKKKTNLKISFTITLEKNMPIGSGLGSSACSIVSTLVAMNKFCNNPLNSTELLVLMGKLEGKISGSIHYDNVAPCYLGGLQLIINNNDIISQLIPYFKEWLWIIAWPGIKIPTEKARKILPKMYDKKICIKHSQNLAGFIHASHSKQEKLAAKLMIDLIAEPYRINSLNNFLHIKKTIKKIGAISFGISGSGPTLFAISENISTAKKIADWLFNNYLENKKGFVHICKLDPIGTRIIR
ncbi:homoserine kinase [Buchnera aphidicola (Mindarus keteleerifoliae)]|uniref:homoserine kinase n=1 Tax=Buchnera aphidicola TaxID=9 RepID=UPI0031B71B52